MRCSTTQKTLIATFGQHNGRWQLQHAAVAASQTGQDQRPAALTIKGGLDVGQAYAGCPTCGVGSFVKCGVCARLSCWNSSRRTFRCGWCGNEGVVEGGIYDVAALDRS